MNIQKIDQTYVANTYARFPLTLVRGSGSLVYDDGGQEYIDLGTGIAVNAFGVCDREWSEAVQAQLLKIQHTSNLFYNEPCALLAEQRCLRTGMKKVFFSNSGAEANECAIKAAREYGERKKGAGYSTIITLRNSFHGRTFATLAATGQEVFHEHFTPLTPGFVHAYANDMEDVKRLVGEHKCCAVMFEVVQGEGGVIALDREFLTELSALAQKEDLLLIADEVQIGNGRSGMLYGYMNYGIKPDIFTTAKGLGGGVPIGATVLGQRVADIFKPGMNGSTFGGNPVCCAGALNILSRIDEALLSEVREKSRYIKETLSASKGVLGVSGLGLMLGVECARPVDEVVGECRQKGVLVIKAKQKVRLLPALNIPWEQLEKAIKILAEVAEG